MPILCASCRMYCYVGAVDRWEKASEHFHTPSRPNRPALNQPALNQPAPNQPAPNQPALNQPAPNVQAPNWDEIAQHPHLHVLLQHPRFRAVINTVVQAREAERYRMMAAWTPGDWFRISGVLLIAVTGVLSLLHLTVLGLANMYHYVL